MAMEKLYSRREVHTRMITAIGFNGARREIVIGCEDGCVKNWEAESGRLLQTAFEHTGWITDLLYWADPKLMLSSSNDGCIIAWGSGGGVSDKIVIGMPVYCMALNPRRHQLVCGVNGGVKVYGLDEDRDSGHAINRRELFFAKYHTDIVRNILCVDSRIYSAGYDQKLIIYDSSYTGDNSLQPILINNNAHDAGICCMVFAKDNENNAWVMTGSFDKTMKIWSADGKLIHKLDNFLDTICGVCYVPRNRTVWVTGGTIYASLFDPKSGDNVSDFIGTFQHPEEEKYVLTLLKYIPEMNHVVATTNRRHLIVWRYNGGGCITTLKCKTAIESLCYTTKVPILIFSGDTEGTIVKWERMQSNHFMYSKEMLVISDNYTKTKRRGNKPKESLGQQLTASEEGLQQMTVNMIKRNSKEPFSHYSFNKPRIPPISKHNHPMTTILKIVFVERLDYIVAASEDSNIYVWGFDGAAVQVLKGMKPHDLETLVEKFGVLLDAESELLPKNSPTATNDSVTNRVAGFICKYIFSEHWSCVTSLLVVGPEHGYDASYVLSGGWDKRICLWNLDKGELHDVFRNASISADNTNSSVELACDGVILDMDYCPPKNEFAYASSDRMVYLRRFSTDGTKMALKNTLQGHDGDVTCIHWNKKIERWITGSEDGTIRIWSPEGLNECETVLSTQGAVTAMCIDADNGGIVVGVQNVIKVYEAETYRLTQTNVGHTETIKCVMHIPERNQYVTCSGDKTVRVWNAWKPPRRNKKVTVKEDKAQEGRIRLPSFEDILNEFKQESHKKGSEKLDTGVDGDETTEAMEGTEGETTATEGDLTITVDENVEEIHLEDDLSLAATTPTADLSER